jgi:hypothetical protein
LEGDYKALQSFNTLLLGFSMDAVPFIKSAGKILGMEKVNLLTYCWPHRDLAAILGLFIDKFGFPERANIIS